VERGAAVWGAASQVRFFDFQPQSAQDSEPRHVWLNQVLGRQDAVLARAGNRRVVVVVPALAAERLIKAVDRSPPRMASSEIELGKTEKKKGMSLLVTTFRVRTQARPRCRNWH
jgi:hypothetical protein